MNAFSLKSKRLLITGASSGLGRAVAVAASEAGASLVITGRNTERLKETFKKLHGDDHVFLIADLTNESDINNLVTQLPLLNGVFF